MQFPELPILLNSEDDDDEIIDPLHGTDPDEDDDDDDDDDDEDEDF